MTFSEIKSGFIKAMLIGAVSLGVTACHIEDFPEPNNPDIRLVENMTVGEIQNLVSGTEAGMRLRMDTYLDDVSVIGREYYRISKSDPRLTGDLLGKGGSVLDNNTFYTTAPFTERYRVIKNTNLLIEGIEKTKADLNATQKANTIGFAKTIQAYQLLLNLNLMYQNGVRVDVANPDQLGPFLSYTASLDAILALLEDGAAKLAGSEAVFPFLLSQGFFTANRPDISYNTPASFLKFNRALAARVSVYKGDYSGALTKLGGSFMNMGGDLKAGPYHYFSEGSGDLANSMFFAKNLSGETRLAHPSFVTGAEAGDSRLAKASERTNVETLDGLSSKYDLWVYTSRSAGIPIIRNEELILIYAEAKIQTGALADGVAALNTIRKAAGLADYSGAMTKDALIAEMLKQRRYSLFAEGHRWVDMRRYNMLSSLPLDRTGDDVWVQFPKPATEGL